MKIFVSFHSPTDSSLFYGLQKHFQSDHTVQVYATNLMNRYNLGPAQMAADPNLDTTIGHPDVAVVFVSAKYLQNHWLPSEASALIELERRRRTMRVLVVPTTGVRRANLPPYLQSRMIAGASTGKLARLKNVIAEIERLPPRKRVFVGHGHAKAWMELRDFMKDQLRLEVDEFNQTSMPGRSTQERLHEMLHGADFAFLVMTAEDDHVDGTRHARENVIHEIGLFQGKLGMQRAILCLERGCQTFSNIDGITYIGFDPGKISGAFEAIRNVLQREGLLQ